MRYGGRSRLSYANVVSTLALFVAMGGTAFAVNEWTGANIQDGTLTGSDIQGKSGSSSIAPVNGSITTHDISGQPANPATGTPAVPGTLTTHDISAGAIGNSDLASSSVTGIKVLNGSLSGSDLTKGTLGGTHIIDGSITPEDLSEAAAGFSEVEIVHGPQDTASQGEDLESRAFCPLGWEISGGGYNAFVSPGNDGDVSVAISQPFPATDGSDQAQWWAHGRNVGGVGVGTAYLTAYAICMR